MIIVTAKVNFQVAASQTKLSFLHLILSSKIQDNIKSFLVNSFLLLARESFPCANSLPDLASSGGITYVIRIRRSKINH